MITARFNFALSSNALKHWQPDKEKAGKSRPIFGLRRSVVILQPSARDRGYED